MSLTSSTMLELGTMMPFFRLSDFNGEPVSAEDFPDAPALLAAFICPHCPYVKHIRPELARLARDYQSRRLAIIAINSNDIGEYPEDGLDAMRQESSKAGYVFPYLFDESQEVARAFRAACTPDFFLFDGKRTLVYRGQFDDSRPGNDVSVKGADLRVAIDLVLAGRPVPAEQKPSMGCNIKWTPGREPTYFKA